MNFLKKTNLINSLIIIVLVSIIILVLVVPTVNMENEKNDLESYYFDHEVDFIVPRPSDDQIVELEGFNHIESVVAYNDFVIDIDHIESRLFLVYGDIEDTIFNTNRLIEGTLEGDGYIVDYSYIQKSGLSIGDEITVAVGSPNVNITKKIIGVVRTNLDSEEPIVLTTNTAEIKSTIETNPSYQDGLEPSSAYIISSDVDVTWNYLRDNYQPLGLKRSRTEFDNDLDYNEYLDIFNSVDYSAQILQYSAEYESAQDDINDLNNCVQSNLTITIILFAIVLIVTPNFTLVIERNKYVKLIVRNGLDAKEVIKTNAIITSIQGVLSIGLMIGLIILIQSKLYPNLALINGTVLYLLISIVILVILSMLINYLVLTIYTKKQIRIKKNIKDLKEEISLIEKKLYKKTNDKKLKDKLENLENKLTKLDKKQGK